MTALSVVLAVESSVMAFAVVFAAAILAFSLAMIFMSADRRGKIERRLGDLIAQDQVE